ncbi:cation:proton antiporter [Salinibaculum rarum]|uniref:cation:proton antiporter n=1 Tax=Salinibaculum rarum TaxID=3058903 RepID=UPI00265E41FE|nr:cation:proton antiporter [Salinibaculum sp. KK48]
MTLVSGEPLVDVVFGATAAFVVVALLTLYRVVRGPTMHDRVVAVNAVGTTTVLIIALLAVAFDAPAFLDIAIVYALLNFLMSIAISKFTVERGGVL